MVRLIPCPDCGSGRLFVHVLQGKIVGALAVCSCLACSKLFFVRLRIEED